MTESNEDDEQQEGNWEYDPETDEWYDLDDW